MKKDAWTFSSNAIRLSCREWLGCAVLLVLALTLGPRAWTVRERLDPGPAFRMPYELSEDYWLYTRWVRHATATRPAVVFGDSVIWGAYVDATNTLPACLNRLADRQLFANLGVPGLHLAAAAGLAEYYTRALRDKAVLVNLNPLWLSSRDVDLTGEEEARVQHPGLVPQFRPRLACYRAERGERITRVASRYLPVLGFLSHLKVLYQDNLDLKSWISEHPAENPYRARDALSRHVRESASAQRDAVSWHKRGMKKQDFPWVTLDASFQWQRFRAAIDVLRSRGNRVFVMVGPFNSHMMEPAALTKYTALRAGIERWLDNAKVPYCRAPDLPSDVFTDASHTTAAGYELIAEHLFADASFKAWLAPAEREGTK